MVPLISFLSFEINEIDGKYALIVSATHASSFGLVARLTRLVARLARLVCN